MDSRAAAPELSGMTSEDMKAFRERWDLTQEQLATALGVGHRTITRMEAGGEIDTRTALAIEALEARYTSGPPADDE